MCKRVLKDGNPLAKGLEMDANPGSADPSRVAPLLTILEQQSRGRERWERAADPKDWFYLCVDQLHTIRMEHVLTLM